MQQQNKHCQEEEKLFDQICRREGWSDECFLDVSSQILPLSSQELPLAFTFCDLPLTSQDHTRLWKDLELYVGTGWLGIDTNTIDQPYS